MKKLILTLFALVSLVAAPAAAKDSIIAYGNLTTGDFVQIGVMEARSSSEARMFMSISDAEFVEDSFGGTVREVNCHDRRETAEQYTRSLGADEVKCFDIRDWMDGTDAHIVMIRQGKLMILVVTANLYGNDPAAILSERQLKDIATDGVWDRVPSGFTVMT